MWIDVRSAVFSSNDPQPAQIFTLSLHDALPIYVRGVRGAFEVQVCKEARGRVREERLNLFAVQARQVDRKSTRLNSSHTVISYAVFCLKKKSMGDAGLPYSTPGRPDARLYGPPT